MYFVKIGVRTTDRYTEISPTDLEGAAGMIEELVSLALREVFRLVIVDRVELIYLPSECDRDDPLDRFGAEDDDALLDDDNDENAS